MSDFSIRQPGRTRSLRNDAESARGPNRLAVVIFVVGLILTGLSVWATKQTDDSTEQRLLNQQTQQAATVLSAAILLIQQPLRNALAVQPSGTADRASFTRSIATSVGRGKTFISASIWQREGGRMVRFAALGAEPAMAVGASSTQVFLKAAFAKSTFTVTAAKAGRQTRIVYALADPKSGHVVYAERAIPANRRSPVDSNSAFADLHYAIYLGPRTQLTTLSTTDVDLKSLPFTGTTATARIPFGDTVVTLVMTPRRHLGASLSQYLPLILLVAGLLLTVVVFLISQLLVRRRQSAEESAAFATGLSERLQRALLPLSIPEIPHLEVAVDYIAGARGVDIGGDWYSIVALGPDHFAFVVGDVSGRGLDAVAVMARARFTLRAYLLRGDSPDVVLTMSAHQFDISQDGHMVTAMVGVGNWRTGEITVANAGHCKPLLLADRGAQFVTIATGPPLGTGPVTYEPTTFTMAPGDTLLCYTDGLIERRTEGIDTGMERLSAAAAAAATGSVTELVGNTVRSLRSEQAEDDIAVLAFRRVPAP